MFGLSILAVLAWMIRSGMCYPGLLPSDLVGFGSRVVESCQEPGYGVLAGGASSKWRMGAAMAFKIVNGDVVSGPFRGCWKSNGPDDVASFLAPLVPDVWMMDFEWNDC